MSSQNLEGKYITELTEVSPEGNKRKIKHRGKTKGEIITFLKFCISRYEKIVIKPMEGSE